MKAIAAIMLTVAVICAAGCDKPENAENSDNNVKVTTYAPQDITLNSARCGGDAIVVPGLSLSEIGVCWSTDRNPTVEDKYRSSSDWNEPFVCYIDGLSPGTTYHVRAFALRGMIYYYGEDMTFTTEEYTGAGDGIVDGCDYIDLGLPSGILWSIVNSTSCMFSTTSSGWHNVFHYRYWDMPTKENWEELYQYTESVWTTQNGVNGRLFTASNGKSVFLPAEEEDGSGFYWSSNYIMEVSPYGDEYFVCYGFKFDSNSCEIAASAPDRYHSVRIVHDAIQ